MIRGVQCIRTGGLRGLPLGVEGEGRAVEENGPRGRRCRRARRDHNRRLHAPLVHCFASRRKRSLNWGAPIINCDKLLQKNGLINGFRLHDTFYRRPNVGEGGKIMFLSGAAISTRKRRAVLTGAALSGLSAFFLAARCRPILFSAAGLG